jgi:gliding motility-associated-like protein
MKLTRILLLAVIVLCCMPTSYAQQLPGQCPPDSINLSNTCANACVLCDFQTFTSSNNNATQGQQVPPNFCPGQIIFPHNVQWVGFVAGSTNISMTITPFNCQLGGNNGLQVGIWGTSDCNSFQVIDCQYQAPAGVPTLLNANNLTVGATYFLVVDGFNADVCEFTVNVTSGSTTVPPVSGDPVMTAPSPPFCSGPSYNFSVTGVQNAGAYSWTINGTPAGGGNATAGITFPENGTYEVCVTPYNVCHGNGQTVCQTIVVGDLDPIIDPPVTICEGRTYTVNGQTFSSAGIQSYTVTDALGCPQIREFELIVTPTVITELEANICLGESYSLGNQTFFATGIYPVTFQAANGCDSVVNLNLTAHFIPPTILFESICSDQGGVEVGGQIFNETGTHVVSMLSYYGCDSTIALNLEVFDPEFVQIDTTICEGSFFEFDYNFYGQAGTYLVGFEGQGGCWNEAEINLTVVSPEGMLNATICEGDTFQLANSTYTAAGTYAKVLPGASVLGCDSTVTINLSIIEPVVTPLDVQICPGQTYSLGGQTYTAAGNYSAVFTAASGCDSIVNLTITVTDLITNILDIAICEGESYTVGTNIFTQTGTYQDTFVTAAGCDSLVILNLTVHPNPETALEITICEGESFSVGSSTYSTSGVYTDVLQAATGCDSTVTLNLTVLPVFTTPLEVSICSGESYAVGSSTYTSSGTYTDILSSLNGCDSTVILQLTVLDTPYTTLDITVCFGETYSVGGTVYTQNGTFSRVLTAANGCDSTVQLNLTVLPEIRQNLNITYCANEASGYQVGNMLYSQTGNYVDTLTALNGCDSIVTLNLVVHPVPVTNLTASICESGSYTVGNSVYTLAGNYSDTLSTTLTGCDSIVNLTLNVTSFYETNLARTICDGESFSVGSSTYTTSGTFQNTFQAVDGCDSIVNLVLTVLPIPVTNLQRTICDGESFSVGSSVYTASGTYQNVLTAISGCDSIVNLSLTVNPVFNTTLNRVICDGESVLVGNNTYTTSGTYTNVLTAANGCDSTVVLNLTVNPIPVTNLVQTICAGETFTIGTATYNASGTYQEVLTAATGCDSIVNLNLTVRAPITTALTRVICSGESVIVGGTPYTTTGTFVRVLTAMNGCDSTVTLNLTVNQVQTTNLVRVICASTSFSVGPNTYTTTGIYQTILSTSAGCDSIINLDLTVRAPIVSAISQTICQGESVQVGNSSYTATGVFTTVLTAANGCDSTVTLNLTVNPIPVTNLVRTVCAGQSFTVGSSTYTTTGNYQEVLTAATGCDSIVNLNLTVLAPISTTLNRAICLGQSVTVGSSTYTNPGTYTNILTAANGCDSTVTLNLSISPTYQVFLTERICDGQSFLVGNNSFSSTGVYQVTLSTVNGCDSVVNLNLTTHPCVLQSLNSSVTASCFGSSDGAVQLTMTVGTPPYNYTWQAIGGTATGNGTISGNNQPINVTGLPAGNYRVTITDFYNVVQVITVTVSQPAPILVTLTGSDYNGYATTCPNESDAFIRVAVSGGNTPYAYTWSNGSNATALDNLPAGVYSLTLTDANGCTSTPIQNTIVLNGPPAIVLQTLVTDPPCFGFAQGSIAVEVSQGGVLPFVFALNGAPYSTRALFTGLTTGTYTVQAQDANGCNEQVTVVVNQPQELVVDLGEDLSIRLGDSINLRALTSYPVDTFIWTGSEGLSCLNCPDPGARPFETAIYTVRVVDRNGCVDTDEVTVFVDKRRQVFFPTAFSPNGDGINDRFYPLTGNDVSYIKSFQVFNRWGESLIELYDFEADNPTYAWDGTHRGKSLNAGVYVFVAEVVFIDGEVVIFKGDVTLMK